MMISRLTILLIATSFGLSKAEEIQFNKSIKPILSNNCFSCHGPDAKVVKGGLQLHLRKKAITLIDDSFSRLEQ